MRKLKKYSKYSGRLIFIFAYFTSMLCWFSIGRVYENNKWQKDSLKNLQSMENEFKIDIVPIDEKEKALHLLKI